MNSLLNKNVNENFTNNENDNENDNENINENENLNYSNIQNNKTLYDNVVSESINSWLNNNKLCLTEKVNSLLNIPEILYIEFKDRLSNQINNNSKYSDIFNLIENDNNNVNSEDFVNKVSLLDKDSFENFVHITQDIYNNLPSCLDIIIKYMNNSNNVDNNLIIFYFIIYDSMMYLDSCHNINSVSSLIGIITDLSKLLPNNESENLTLLCHKFSNINSLDDIDDDSEIQNILTSLSENELTTLKDMIVSQVKNNFKCEMKDYGYNIHDPYNTDKSKFSDKTSDKRVSQLGSRLDFKQTVADTYMEKKHQLVMPDVSHEYNMTYVPPCSWNVPQKRSRSCSSDGTHCPVQPLVAPIGENLFLDFDRLHDDLEDAKCPEEDLFKNKIDTSKGSTKDNTYLSVHAWSVPDKKTPHCLPTQSRCLKNSYLARGTDFKNVFEYTRVGSMLPDFEYIERE